jgi:hypothetical protein
MGECPLSECPLGERSLCECPMGKCPWCEFPMGKCPWCECPMGKCVSPDVLEIIKISCGIYCTVRTLFIILFFFYNRFHL